MRNADFLALIFSALPDRAKPWVTGFTPAPSEASRRASNPDLLLRLVLGLLAEQGYVVMPADMLRAAVRVVQKRIERGVANATG